MSLTQIEPAGVIAGEWNLTASGSDHYVFAGTGLTGSVNDPDLHLVRGLYYVFNNQTSGSSHPFRIQSTSGTSGTAYNTGVTNNGGGNGVITFRVPLDAPDKLFYQCTDHANMVGNIYCGGVADSGITTAKIADQAVDLTKLPHGDGSSNGKFLRSNNGADPTWETVSSGSDTTYSISCVDGDLSDQEKIRLTAGGSGSGTDDVVLVAGTGLSIARSGDTITYTNSNPTVLGGDTGISFNDNATINMGTSNEFQLYHNGSGATVIKNTVDNRNIHIQAKQNSDIIFEANDTGNGKAAVFSWSDDATPIATAELYYNNNKKLETTNTGITVTGGVAATTFTGALAGNADSATNVGLTDESTDTTCFPLFAVAATGNQAPKTGSNLTFNSSSGALAATSFAGDGSALTNLPGGGKLLQVQSAEYATESNSNSNSWGNTGLTVNITPASASNTMVCWVHMNGLNITNHSATNAIDLRLKCITGGLDVEKYFGWQIGYMSQQGVLSSGSPWSRGMGGASIVYKTNAQTSTNQQTWYVQARANQNTSNAYWCYGTAISYILVMEVAA